MATDFESTRWERDLEAGFMQRIRKLAGLATAAASARRVAALVAISVLLVLAAEPCSAMRVSLEKWNQYFPEYGPRQSSHRLTQEESTWTIPAGASVSFDANEEVGKAPRLVAAEPLAYLGFRGRAEKFIELMSANPGLRFASLRLSFSKGDGDFDTKVADALKGRGCAYLNVYSRSMVSAAAIGQLAGEETPILGLEISGTVLGDLALEINKATSLRALQISGYVNEFFRLKDLRLPELQALDVGSCVASNDDLRTIVRFSNVEYLRLPGGTLTQRDLIAYAQSMAALKHLVVYAVDVKLDRVLRACPGLQTLCLSGGGSLTFASLSEDETAPELSEIDLGWATVGEGTWAALASLKNLRAVSLANMSIGAKDDWAEFTKRHSLESISMFSVSGLDADSLLAFAKRGTLKRARLTNCNCISNAALAALCDNKNLIYLGVRQSGGFGRGGLREILRAKGLEELDLMNIQMVDDKLLEDLGKSCKALKRLDLVGCDGVSTAGVEKALIELKELAVLEVRACDNVDKTKLIDALKKANRSVFVDR